MPDTDTDRVVLTSIPASQKRRWKLYALTQKQTLRDFVREAVEAHAARILSPETNDR